MVEGVQTVCLHVGAHTFVCADMCECGVSVGGVSVVVV
jgi:hypothetical protein